MIGRHSGLVFRQTLDPFRSAIRFRPPRPRFRNHFSTSSSQPSSNPGHETSGSTLNSRSLRRYLPLPLLRELSARTKVPIPSLAISFLILHELTAIIPVIGLYFIFDSIGAGEKLIGLIRDTGNLDSLTSGHENRNPYQNPDRAGDELKEFSWSWRDRIKGWYFEGERKVEKVGRRYGWWGLEKGSSVGSESMVVSGLGSESNKQVYQVGTGTGLGGKAAEGIANAISAYVVVKAMLPLRIAFSIGAAPSFARFALEPMRKLGGKLIRR